MKEGRKYLFVLENTSGKDTFYTGIIIKIEGNFIFIKDKFGKEVGFNQSSVKQFREVSQ